MFLLAGTEDSSTVTGQRDVTSLDTRRLATTINEVDDCCHSKDDRIATVKQVVRGWQVRRQILYVERVKHTKGLSGTSCDVCRPTYVGEWSSQSTERNPSSRPNLLNSVIATIRRVYFRSYNDVVSPNVVFSITQPTVIHSSSTAIYSLYKLSHRWQTARCLRRGSVG